MAQRDRGTLREAILFALLGAVFCTAALSARAQSAFNSGGSSVQGGGGGPAPATTYINTTFNEGADGAALAGTAPAIGPAGTTWGGSGWVYAAGVGVQSTGSGQVMNIDAHQHNQVVRLHIPSGPGCGTQFLLSQDPTVPGSGAIAVNLGCNGGIAFYDQNNGSGTTIASYGSFSVTTGDFILTIKDDLVTVEANGQIVGARMIAGSLNRNGTVVGVLNFLGAATQISSFSVSNQ